MKNLIILIIIFASITSVKSQDIHKDSAAIRREKLIEGLKTLAEKIKGENPDAAIVLLNLASVMYIKQEKALADKTILATTEILEMIKRGSN